MRVDRASVVAAVGQNVTLHCTVTGDPEPSMRWQRGDHQPLVLGTVKHRVQKCEAKQLAAGRFLPDDVFYCVLTGIKVFAGFIFKKQHSCLV